MYLGNDEILEMYLGDDSISEAYLGEDLVFSSGPFMGLKVIPRSIGFNPYSLSGTTKVKSSEPWQITSNPLWITASPTTGDSGETIVTLVSDELSAATSGSVMFESNSYSASLETSFNMVQLVDAVRDDSAPNWDLSKYLDTGIYVTNNIGTTIRVKYIGGGVFSDRIVGFDATETGGNDDTDFRYFPTMADAGSQRIDTLPYSLYESDVEQDITLGNLWVFDNKSQQTIASTLTGGTISDNTTIRVDMSTNWIEEVIISVNNTPVFDGKAAYLNGEYGLYDTVSNTFLTDATLNIVPRTAPTPPTPPTPSGRTIEITGILTPSVPTETYPGTYVYVNDGVIYGQLSIAWDDNENDFVTSMEVGDGGGEPAPDFTLSYSGGTFTLVGPWEDNIEFYFNYDAYEECMEIPSEDRSVYETFSSDTMTVAFPSLVPMLPCQCEKEGGEWDGDNEVCVHPTVRTLSISNIPTPPVPTGGESVYVTIGLTTSDDLSLQTDTYMEFKKEYEIMNDTFVVTMTMDDGNGNPVTGYTTAYTNSALTISGPWGDEVSICYEYSDGDINCEHVPDDAYCVDETFSGNTISLAFPTLEVNGECQCGKDGGEWDYDNEVCVHPTVRTLSISNIPTPPSPYDGEDPWTKINIDDSENYAEFGIVYDWNNYQYVISTTILDGNSDPITGFTTAFTNSALTIDGPWGDEVNIYYDFVDSYEFGNCLHVGEDSATTTEYFDDGETAVSSITLTFPSLEVDAECQCGKDGGDWDGDNNICLHDAALIIDGVDIPDDGGTHEYRILDSDGNTVSVLSIDTSDWSYTYEDNPDGTISHTITTLNVDDYGDLSAGGFRWELTGFFYGEYDIQLDSSSLISSMPDFDGSSVANYISWDSTEGDYVITTYSCYDEWNCMVNDCGNWNPNTGECDCV